MQEIFGPTEYEIAIGSEVRSRVMGVFLKGVDLSQPGYFLSENGLIEVHVGEKDGLSGAVAKINGTVHADYIKGKGGIETYQLYGDFYMTAISLKAVFKKGGFGWIEFEWDEQRAPLEREDMILETLLPQYVPQ